MSETDEEKKQSDATNKKLTHWAQGEKHCRQIRFLSSSSSSLLHLVGFWFGCKEKRFFYSSFIFSFFWHVRQKTASRRSAVCATGTKRRRQRSTTERNVCTRHKTKRETKWNVYNFPWFVCVSFKFGSRSLLLSPLNIGCLVFGILSLYLLTCVSLSVWCAIYSAFHPLDACVAQDGWEYGVKIYIKFNRTYLMHISKRNNFSLCVFFFFFFCSFLMLFYFLLAVVHNMHEARLYGRHAGDICGV